MDIYKMTVTRTHEIQTNQITILGENVQVGRGRHSRCPHEAHWPSRETPRGLAALGLGARGSFRKTKGRDRASV